MFVFVPEFCSKPFPQRPPVSEVVDGGSLAGGSWSGNRVSAPKHFFVFKVRIVDGGGMPASMSFLPDHHSEPSTP